MHLTENAKRILFTFYIFFISKSSWSLSTHSDCRTRAPRRVPPSGEERKFQLRNWDLPSNTEVIIQTIEFIRQNSPLSGEALRQYIEQSNLSILLALLRPPPSTLVLALSTTPRNNYGGHRQDRVHCPRRAPPGSPVEKIFYTCKPVWGVQNDSVGRPFISSMFSGNIWCQYLLFGRHSLSICTGGRGWGSEE